MHECIKRIPLKSNLRFDNKVYIDTDTILKNIKSNIKNDHFIIKDSDCELYLTLDKLSNTTLILKLEVFNEAEDAYDSLEFDKVISLFESISECRNFFRNVTSTYIEEINNFKLKFVYFDDFDGSYGIYNNKLYAAIYDFSTNKFVEKMPEVKEEILHIDFDDHWIDKIFDR